jgi:hypothetical protein
MQTTCDTCGVTFATSERHVAIQPRPSDPSELCAVMWACPPCGRELGWPTPEDVEADLEAGKLPGIAFLSL